MLSIASLLRKAASFLLNRSMRAFVVVQHSFCNFPDDCTFALQSVVERSETKLCSANARRADVASTPQSSR